MKEIKCPTCRGIMKPTHDMIEEDRIEFEAYTCVSCGEELMNMHQLKELAKKYRMLRKAKEITFAKWGNSIAVRIPKHITEELRITPGSHALINKEKEGIKIMLAQ